MAKHLTPVLSQLSYFAKFVGVQCLAIQGSLPAPLTQLYFVECSGLVFLVLILHHQQAASSNSNQDHCRVVGFNRETREAMEVMSTDVIKSVFLQLTSCLLLKASREVSIEALGNVKSAISRGLKIVNWVPPKSGWVKLNFDGGFSYEYESGISSGILRDSDGLPLFSFTELLRGGTCYRGEATALLRCLQFAHARGYRKVWAEGDAKCLVETVLDKGRYHEYGDDIVGDIRRWMKKFDSCELTFVFREANEAADKLVKVISQTGMPSSTWEGEDLPLAVKMIVDRERGGYSYIRL
ncbi:hypothetical protein Ancab_039834 [Ancistrocladus abbreviatus]